MKPANAPCKDCKDRRVTTESNCHTACPKYQGYIETRRQERKEERKIALALNEYLHDERTKHAKAKQQHKGYS